MTGNVPTPQIMQFTEINIGKYKTTRHYELTESNAVNPATQKINVARDRSFARSLPHYWLSYRLNNRWRRITGLFKVDGTKYFKGDIGRKNVKESLVLVRFCESNRTATVYTFKGYYSSNPTVAIHLIKSKGLG